MGPQGRYAVMGGRCVIMLGDVNGESGLCAVETELPALKDYYNASLAVVNGENSADGFGMSALSAQRLFNAGADVITSGNHIWEKRVFLQVLEDDCRILRPANYYRAAGRGFVCVEKDGIKWLVINLQGREYMTAVDCPFRAFDEIFAAFEGEALPVAAIVDFHGESAREKEAFGLYADGRAAIVAGTHTHIQSADERLLPKGTAYISDLGMTGDENSIIGMSTEICLKRARSQVLYRLECSNGKGTAHGAALRVGEDGRPVSIERFPLK